MTRRSESLPAVAALAGGVISILVQGMVLRDALFGRHAAELATGMVLAGWLAGSGIGAALGGKLIHRRTVWLTGMLVLSALGLAQTFLADDAGVIPLISVIPAGFAAGVVFVQPFAYLETSKVYALEAFGACLGGVIFILVSPHCLTVPLFFVCLVSCAFGLLLIRSVLPGLSVLMIVAAAVLLGLPGMAEQRLTEADFSMFDEILVYPSAYGEIVVAERNGQYAAFRSGVLETSWPAMEPAEEKMVIPMLALSPRKLLYIGSSPEEVSIAAVWPGLDCLDVVVPDRAIIAAIPGFPENTLSGDGRAFLSGTQNIYDAIIVSTGLPLSLMSNRFYTREFMKTALGRLDDNGVLVLYMEGGENRLLPGQAALIQSILQAGDGVFNWNRILPSGGVTMFFGKGEEKTIDGAVLAERLDSLSVNTVYMTQGVIPFQLSELRINALEQQVSREKARPNTDLSPEGFRLASANWALRMGYGSSYRVMIVAGLILAFLLLIVSLKMSGRPADMLSYSAIGFSGLAVETVAIVVIQATLGYSYTLVGAVTGVFMAGMAVGALMFRRIKYRAFQKGRTLSVCSVAAGALLVMGYNAEIVDPKLLAGLFLLLAAGAGSAVGIAFPAVASVFRKYDTGRIGLISLAGHAGSAAGAILVPVLLFPLVGASTALLIAATATALTALLTIKREKH